MIDVSNDISTGIPSGVNCDVTSKSILRENPNYKTNMFNTILKTFKGSLPGTIGDSSTNRRSIL